MAIGQQVTVAVSKSAQTAIGDLPTTASEYLRLGTTSRTPPYAIPVNEDTRQETGGGSEFPDDIIPSHKEFTYAIEAVLTSHLAAFIVAHGIGKVVKTLTGPFQYDGLVRARGTDSDDVSTFGLIGLIEGTDYDRAYSGCSIASWEITVVKGKGRTTSTVVINVVGTGKETKPSAIVIPAKLPIFDLKSASLAFNFDSFNYTADARINRLTLGMDFGLSDEDPYPAGSGVDVDGYATGNRMRQGDRSFTLGFDADFVDSVDLDKVSDRTEGITTLSLIHTAAAEALSFTFPRSVLANAQFGEGDQSRITLAHDQGILEPSAGDIVQAQAITAADGFGDAAV